MDDLGIWNRREREMANGETECGMAMSKAYDGNEVSYHNSYLKHSHRVYVRVCRFSLVFLNGPEIQCLMLLIRYP